MEFPITIGSAEMKQTPLSISRSGTKRGNEKMKSNLQSRTSAFQVN